LKYRDRLFQRGNSQRRNPRAKSAENHGILTVESLARLLKTFFFSFFLGLEGFACHVDVDVDVGKGRDARVLACFAQQRTARSRCWVGSGRKWGVLFRLGHIA
jgi:hypothetical protein